MASMTISTGIGEYAVTGSDGPTLQSMLVTCALAKGIQPREVTAFWTTNCEADLLAIQLDLAERYGEYKTLHLFVPGSVTRFDHDGGRVGYGITVANSSSEQ